MICIGKYGDIPKIPSFPHNKGPEIFQGQVLHTIDYSKLDRKAATELLKGKKVVVVGYKKSGIDLAMECAEANQGMEFTTPANIFKVAIRGANIEYQIHYTVHID